jgi:aryl-alcohol dehydrogenase-like predicted oxidoreductase
VKPPSDLALGAMNFGRRTSETESLRIIDRALERGITWIDTANVYNEGESERVVGKALAGRRTGVRVATKVGFFPRDGKPEGASPTVIRKAIDESLERLRVDQVDLYYLHRPDPATRIEDSLGAMAALVAAGKVKEIGVSNFASWQVLEIFHLCDKNGWPRPTVSQVIYNVLIRQIDIEYLRFAARFDVHTTVYNALAGGILSARYDVRPETPLGGTRFASNEIYQRRYWTDRMFAHRAALADIAAGKGMSLDVMAYAWLAGRPGVDSILIGPASVEQLDVAIDACARDISPAALARIDDLTIQVAGTDAKYAR